MVPPRRLECKLRASALRKRRAEVIASALKLSSPETRQFWEIAVLHEDDCLLALDKPALLLTSPDRYDPDRPNLMKLLHRGIERGAPWALERGLSYLSNAHRLDFVTSGVLLLAKSKPALVSLADQFGAEKPLKTYIALVQGHPEQNEFDVDAPIGSHPLNPAVVRVDRRNGKKSFTRFEVIERFRNHTLLRCLPRTGRTHQIRAHLRHVKLPIVADELYGGAPLLLSRIKTGYRLKPGATERPLISRAALHALELQVIHPMTSAKTVISAPWPEDITLGVKYLRRYHATG